MVCREKSQRALKAVGSCPVFGHRKALPAPGLMDSMVIRKKIHAASGESVVVRSFAPTEESRAICSAVMAGLSRASIAVVASVGRAVSILGSARSGKHACVGGG